MAKKEVTDVIEIDQEAIKRYADQISQETDEQLVEKFRRRFEVIGKMTAAVLTNDIRAMIVVGPPGVGKSHIVTEILEGSHLFNNGAGSNIKRKFEIVKGTSSAVGMFAKLWEFRHKGNVIVFDVCDRVLQDFEALDILKGALDSGEKRTISWNKDSRMLRAQTIDNTFEFEAGIIFITNTKFDLVTNKRLRDYLDALQSRCHYIDLQMNTNRERILRIKQIVGDGMLDKYDFDDPDIACEEIVNFIEVNQDQLREISLRMVIKIADNRKSFPTEWVDISTTTCMREAS